MQKLLYDLTYKFYTESGVITDWVYSVGHTRSRGEECTTASSLHVSQKNTAFPNSQSVSLKPTLDKIDTLTYSLEKQRYRHFTCLYSDRRTADVELQFVALAVEGGGWVDRTTPRPSYPRENAVSIDRRLGRSGWVWKISFPPKVDPQTVQPVADRYTNYAIPNALYRKEPCRNPCTTDYSTVP
jgi:hypothetical protein